METDELGNIEMLAFKASLVDCAQQSIIVTDALGTITYCNRYATTMYGWEAEQMLGHSVSMLVPEDLAPQAENVMASLLAGRPWQGEFVVQRHDGSRFLIHVLDIPLLDESGALVGIIGVSDDVTNLRQLEGAARLAREQLQRALDVAKMAAWTWSPSTDELCWSADGAALAGVELAQLPTTMTDALARLEPNERTSVRQLVDRIHAGESELDHSFEFENYHIYAKASRHIDASGAVEVIGVVQDVTERVRAEQANRELRQQLEQTQKLESLGRLAGGIAHDINNLLAGVSLYTSLLRDDSNLAPGQRFKLDAILDLCKRGSALTENLLGFARRGAAQLQHVDVRQLIEDTANLLRHTVGKTIQITTCYALPEPRWWGDRNQLHQLIMNLCLNAVDALAERGSCLKIQCSPARIYTRDEARDLEPGDYVRVDVIDDGCGMDEHALASAFEPFFTTKAEGRGTGLGLSMAHGTAHGHGGSIAIESAVGRGTTVSVWIPTVTEPVRQAYEPDRAEDHPHPRVRARVLLAEDEGAIRMAASELLQRLGYEVVEAADGEQALHRFREHDGQFAVVLLDLQMPRVDGTAAFHALRREHPELPIVIMSGHSKTGAVSQLLEAGAAAFLPKPFDSDRLASAVEQALARS